MTAVLDVAGVLQFDGQGNLTANWTQVSSLASTAVSASRSYSVGANCLAAGTLTDTAPRRRR